MYERAPVRPSNQYFVVYDGATSVLHTRIRFKLLRVNFEQVQNSVWGHNGNLASCVAVVEWLLKKNPVWYWCIMTGRVILYALFSTCCIRSPTIELATLEFGSHPHATYVDLFLYTGLRRLMPCTWSKLLVVFVACVGAMLMFSTLWDNVFQHRLTLNCDSWGPFPLRDWVVVQKGRAAHHHVSQQFSSLQPASMKVCCHFCRIQPQKIYDYKHVNIPTCT